MRIKIGLLQYHLFLAFPDIRPEINGDTYCQKQLFTKNNDFDAVQPLALLTKHLSTTYITVFDHICKNLRYFAGT